MKYPHEHKLFMKPRDGGKVLVVCLYVNDLINTSLLEMIATQL